MIFTITEDKQYRARNGFVSVPGNARRVDTDKLFPFVIDAWYDPNGKKVVVGRLYNDQGKNIYDPNWDLIEESPDVKPIKSELLDLVRGS